MNRPLQLRPKSTTVLVLDSLELRRAGVVSFLCTPAADEVRGAAWTVDGGWVAQ